MKTVIKHPPEADQPLAEKSIVLIQGVLSQKALAKIKPNKDRHVFVCEGRPSLEAGKINTRFLLSKKIIPTVITDNMAGFLFFKGWVKEVIIGCQYADNTGALCDIGALICGVLAKKHKVPVKLVEGKLRSRFLGDPKEVLSFEEKLMAPKNTASYLPLVEWVPGKYLR